MHRRIVSSSTGPGDLFTTPAGIKSTSALARRAIDAPPIHPVRGGQVGAVNRRQKAGQIMPHDESQNRLMASDFRTITTGYSFDGGAITSDAGALLLGRTDRAIGLVDRLAACFTDYRKVELIEHRVATLVGQRVFGIALGYEDLNDHDELRRDPVMAVLAGKLEAGRANCAPVARKSTLNRLELSRETATRYHKIAADPNAIKSLFVTLFLEAYETPPEEIILDIDATDDPLHGHQEGRFFRLLRFYPDLAAHPARRTTRANALKSPVPRPTSDQPRRASVLIRTVCGLADDVHSRRDQR